ncbi:hypothetical protein DE146DRAFT_629377 [Phaeosphaeria sp. MPI-PUGE-AT-0046c]|nr:hypothetical protein DE146DRAFT_629377 [Phaeosphaeria sp. MPI-PUGE-AT-0046c]
MAQRIACPSMGLLRCSLSINVSSRTATRPLSSTARRLEDGSSDAAPSAPPSDNSNTRKARSETALRQITSLQNRRVQPGGLARGQFRSGQAAGQMAQRTPRDPSAVDAGQKEGVPGQRMAKFAPRPTSTRGPSPPGGAQMVRGPGPPHLNRNATVGSMRGPNLNGRSGSGGPRGPRGKGDQERGTKKREKRGGAGGGGPSQSTSVAEVDPAATLSDSMVQHLLRLQRQEWDRVPYEPKYAPGSFAANQLIHEGRELFRGEVPPVKHWGKLEQRIGVVGMFGAEAHLKVRRVPDGDDASFGEEVEEYEMEAATKESAAVPKEVPAEATVAAPIAAGTKAGVVA